MNKENFLKKKNLNFIKKVVFIIIVYIFNKYYKNEIIILGKIVIDFLLKNHILILKSFGMFTIFLIFLVTIWFIVMLYKVGIDGIDIILNKVENFFVKLLKIIFIKITHF